VILATLWLLGATTAGSQQLSSDQQKCLGTLHKRGGKLAATQGKENTRCIKDAGRNKLIGQTADACVEADARGKVQKASANLLGSETKSCTAPTPPYGYTSGTAFIAAMLEHELGLIDDTFGSPLAGAIINANGDSAGASCQATLSKSYEKVAATRGKEFARCAKGGMKAGTITDGIDLAECLGDDSRAKVAAAKQKTVEAAQKRCAGVDITDAFPSLCSGASDASDLGACVASAADCRVCRAFSQAGAVIGACDLYDDGSLNGSCAKRQLCSVWERQSRSRRRMRRRRGQLGYHTRCLPLELLTAVLR
jgi:hypothetical protein